MTDSFTIHTNAPHCLNFYDLYSKYLSQPKEKGKFKISLHSKTIQFSTNFEANFKELWHSLRKQMANDKYDSQIFMMKTISFMRIFLIIIYVIKNYSKELICSFKVWWTSIAGQLSLEWSVSDFSRQLYRRLSFIYKTTPNKTFTTATY